MKIIDLYKGFEGEPEIKFVQMAKNGLVTIELRLWIGYFDSIIKLIKPNQNGNWEGVPLFYHTATGWYNKYDWKCKDDDKELFLAQLNGIQIGRQDKELRLAYEELVKILESSIKSKNDLYFIYD